MDPTELRFVLAHELAHAKLRHPRRRLLLVSIPLLLMMLPMLYLPFRIGNPSLPRLPFGIAFGGPIVAMFFPLFFGHRLYRTQELEADRLALEMTGDLAAAESALWKLKFGSPMPHLHEQADFSTHPETARRIAALREVRIA